MPYEIRVRGNTGPEDNAAVVAAFNALIASLRAIPNHRVDAGGSVIDAVVVGADEIVGADQKLAQGTVF